MAKRLGRFAVPCGLVLPGVFVNGGPPVQIVLDEKPDRLLGRRLVERPDANPIPGVPRLHPAERLRRHHRLDRNLVEFLDQTMRERLGSGAIDDSGKILSGHGRLSGRFY